MTDVDALPVVPEEKILVMENVSRIDRETYFQAVRLRGRGWKMRIFTVLGLALIPTGLLMYQPWVWCMGIAIILLAQFSHVILGYRDYSKLKRIHPSGSWEKTIRFYEDRIETDSGAGSPTVARYRDLRRLRESDRILLLEFGQKAPATFLCKDSFTRGGADQLKAFLSEAMQADGERTEPSVFRQFADLFRQNKKQK